MSLKTLLAKQPLASSGFCTICPHVATGCASILAICVFWEALEAVLAKLFSRLRIGLRIGLVLAPMKLVQSAHHTRPMKLGLGIGVEVGVWLL